MTIRAGLIGAMIAVVLKLHSLQLAPHAPSAPIVTAVPTPLVGLGPFTLGWDPYPDPTATFTVYVDDAKLTTAPAGATSVPITLLSPGAHLLSVTATNTQGIEGAPGTLAVSSVAGSDPACVAPLGAHAPAIFVTGLGPTTGRAGSKSFLSFQLAAPDPIVELAIVIDSLDSLPIARGTDLRPVGSLWFTQPIAGTHTLGVRVVTAFGCVLARQAVPLVVLPCCHSKSTSTIISICRRRC